MTRPIMLRFFSIAIALASLLSVSLPAAATVDEVDGYVREMPPGQMNTAAFMRLQNTGDKPVEIVGAESPLANSIELHRHTHANGMMRMEKVTSITIPAGGEFVFKSGDYHVMIMMVKQPLRVDDKFPLVFVTAAGERIELSLPVKPIVADSH